MNRPITIPVPAGAKGGKGGKGGSGGGGGQEAPDSLRSIQYAKIIDLIGEGTITGLANNLQSVYFDGVKLQNPDGSFNFKNVQVNWRTGTPNQTVMPGQNGVQAEKAVGVQIKTTLPVVRTITNPDVDRVRITVAVPTLQEADKKGNVNGTSVSLGVYLQANGGGYQLKTNIVITGKTTSRYQRSVTFALTGSAPWDIRIVRNTADSTSNLLANDTYWDTYGEITDAKMRYRNSAIVGIAIDAAQFSSIPTRVYDVIGMTILVPTNYDPVARSYSGVWDGTFKLAYSNNPAWIFYDLCINTRYGIGAFIAPSQIDKFALYSIAQWCDGPVKNGKGGYEPRWTCNAIITDRQEAFDLLQSICSVFRGAHFWTGGQLVAIADKPADPVGMYTNANVVEGTFTYQGSDLRARHTQASVTWADPDNLGQGRVTLVEDQDAISRYGLNRIDMIGIGCTSEGQAHRIGRWALYSEINEVETVKFRVGLQGAWCRPGDIVQIADINVAGERYGGRLEYDTTGDVLRLDNPVTFHDVAPAYASVIRADGVMVTVPVNIEATDVPVYRLLMGDTIVPAPLVGSPWVLSTGTLATQLFRVVAVEQAEDDVTWTVTALSHNPSKWAYVERDIALADRDVTNFGLPTITNLQVQETLVSIVGATLNISLNLSWQSTAQWFEVRWRLKNSNWNTATTQLLSIDFPVQVGIYELVVTPLSAVGVRGQSATQTYSVAGLLGAPNPVKNFRIQNVSGVAHLTWAPAVDFDVLVAGSFELRYSPRTSGANWASSNIAVMSIPGRATTVEVPYRPGTYLIKAKDSSDVYSTDAAVIVAVQTGTAKNFARLCESPDWLGSFDNTFVTSPQLWLTLASTGSGVWDDQTAEIDVWPDVDNLPVGPSGPAPGIGFYYFSQQLDMGGIFPVDLVSDMLAFPYMATSPFVDSRPGTVDSWSDWDASDADASGMAVMEVRQTNDDPASGGAIWGPWQGMQAGTYEGRGFQFRIRLEAPTGQNVAVEEACVNVDFSAKQDSGSDIPWVASSMSILFNIKFLETPAIAIAVQDAVTGDYAKITAKSATGFTIELRDANNLILSGTGSGARTFDWQAQGH